MSENVFPYSPQIQIKIFSMLLFDEKGFAENMEVIKPEHFENKALGDMVSLLQRFYNEYKRRPSVDEFLEEVDLMLGADRRLPVDEYMAVAEEIIQGAENGGFDYVRNKAMEFIRYQAIKRAVIESVEVVQRRQDYNTILGKVRSALSIGEDIRELGVNYFDALEDRLERRREGVTRGSLAIPTGLARLDRALGGGIAPMELGVIMGPAKRGKTILSVNISAGALFVGKNVLHVIMEGGEERIQTAYDSKFSGVRKEDLKENEVEVRRKVQEFFQAPGCGRLYIKHFPATRCSALTLENLIARLRLKNNFHTHLILIDYLGLMVPATKEMAKSTERHAILGAITKELLGLAQSGEHAIWCLHQSNRSSFDRNTVDMRHSGDSIEPMRDADIILTLNQTAQDANAANPYMRILLAGGREMADRGMVKVGIDKSTCLFYDFESAGVPYPDDEPESNEEESE